MRMNISIGYFVPFLFLPLTAKRGMAEESKEYSK